jgi:23S rRNA pseudouridine955/2504/2580 synthase
MLVKAPDSPSTERTPVRKEVIGAEDAGVRLDKVLARLLPGVPRTRIFRLLRHGEVRLNGKRVGAEVRVAEGDVLRVPPVRLEDDVKMLDVHALNRCRDWDQREMTLVMKVLRGSGW